MKKILYTLLFLSTFLINAQTGVQPVGSLKINVTPATVTGNPYQLVRNPTTKLVEQQLITGGGGGGIDHVKGNYDALNNIPVLANGVGVRGDYYTVKTAGTQFGYDFKLEDRIEYDGIDWVKVINNNSGLTDILLVNNIANNNATFSDGVSQNTTITPYGLFSGNYGLTSDEGYNFISNTLAVNRAFGKFNLNGFSFRTHESNSGYSIYKNDNVTAIATFQAPNTLSGTFTQPISVNGVVAGIDGNINVPFGSDYVLPSFVDSYIGTRLKPLPAYNGFEVTKSVNEAIGYRATNNDDIGNGALAGFTAKGAGSLYVNSTTLTHFGASYFIPYFAGNGTVLSNKKLLLGTTAGSDVEIYTGTTTSNVTPKIIVKNNGQIEIPIEPTLNNVGRLLGRLVDGKIVSVDMPSNLSTNISYVPSTRNVISSTGTGFVFPIPDGVNYGLSINDYTTLEKNKLASTPTTFFNGNYASLTGIPTTFNPSVHVHVIGDVTNLQSTIDGKVADVLNDNVTTIAPSQNAVFDALALKQNNLGYTPYNSTNPNGYQTASQVQVIADAKVENNLTASITIAPSKTAVNNALALKENSITAGTISQYFRGDKTFQTLDKTSVGLSNLDNTSDINKPISTATQTALNGKENTITVLPISKGGTNNTSIGTAGQLAKVNAGATGIDYFTPTYLATETDPNALKIASNLSDLNNVSTARTNLGLGTLATQSGTFSGTSSGTNTGDNAPNTTYANDYRASNFVAGTNYLAPNGNGSALTGLTGTQITGNISGNSASITGSVTQSQVTGLTTSLDNLVPYNGAQQDVNLGENALVASTIQIGTTSLIDGSLNGLGFSNGLPTSNGTLVNSVNLATKANQQNTQIFTANGTWTKPAGAKAVSITLISGGGGAGSGRKGASATIRCAGGPGASAGVSKMVFDANDLPATVTITVGTAGLGGLSQTTNSTNGNNGTNGGNTSFGAYLKSIGGGGGVGGTATSGTGGAFGSGLTFDGVSGTSASITGLAGSAANASTKYGSSSGAPGGGITSANVASLGGNGNVVPTFSNQTGLASNAGAIGANGTNGATPISSEYSHGGGGGGSSLTGNAGNGGNASGFGSGGGGGGASVDATGNSGAGGNGTPGLAIIKTYF